MVVIVAFVALTTATLWSFSNEKSGPPGGAPIGRGIDKFKEHSPGASQRWSQRGVSQDKSYIATLFFA